MDTLFWRLWTVLCIKLLAIACKKVIVGRVVSRDAKEYNLGCVYAIHGFDLFDNSDCGSGRV